MHKIVSNILKLFEYVLITCILFISIIVAINFVQLNIMKKDYTNFMSYSIFKVISDSMAPTIVKNDVIIVKINDEIKKGDIITYKLKDDFITHRVVDIKNNEYITRGDSNNVGDSPIPKEKIVGKVVKIIPKLGIWKDILMTPKIFILLIVTVILFSSSFKDWTKRQYKKYKDYKITSDSIIEGRNKDE
ncbi:MAG: signal peptidase I [Bacilli bacterium]|nr:signal peptidase I [Bacilli bacterium]